MRVRAIITFEYEARPQDYNVETLTIDTVREIDTIDAMIETLTYSELDVNLIIEEVQS